MALVSAVVAAHRPVLSRGPDQHRRPWLVDVHHHVHVELLAQTGHHAKVLEVHRHVHLFAPVVFVPQHRVLAAAVEAHRCLKCLAGRCVRVEVGRQLEVPFRRGVRVSQHVPGAILRGARYGDVRLRRLEMGKHATQLLGSERDLDGHRARVQRRPEVSRVGDAVHAEGLPESPAAALELNRYLLRRVHRLREQNALNLLRPERREEMLGVHRRLQRALGDGHVEGIERRRLERDGEERGPGGVYRLDRQPAVPLAFAIAGRLDEHLRPEL